MDEYMVKNMKDEASSWDGGRCAHKIQAELQWYQRLRSYGKTILHGYLA